jgi:hypothetical protein
MNLASRLDLERLRFDVGKLARLLTEQLRVER